MPRRCRWAGRVSSSCVCAGREPSGNLVAASGQTPRTAGTVHAAVQTGRRTARPDSRPPLRHRPPISPAGVPCTLLAASENGGDERCAAAMARSGSGCWKVGRRAGSSAPKSRPMWGCGDWSWRERGSGLGGDQRTRPGAARWQWATFAVAVGATQRDAPLDPPRWMKPVSPRPRGAKRRK